ncbi:MSMEG_0567/Sll0786 family nitrogen starvation N-acetyltransferase [Acidisoma cellulosilyticum]
MRMFDGPIPLFMPGEYRFTLALDPWQIAAHHALRRQVFCTEQQIFKDDDRDATDDVATHIIAYSCIAGAPDEIVGTVRIHQPEPGLWWGSRLAVAEEHRRLGRLGAELIRLAVCTAHARGCHTFLAHVQAQNFSFFRRLHWDGLESVMLHGRPHHVMRAQLNHYPPHGRPVTHLLRPVKQAA